MTGNPPHSLHRMPHLSGDDVQAEGPNPSSSIRVRPVYPDWTLAMRRRRTHVTDVVILGFRLTSAWPLAFRLTSARLSFPASRSLAFRRTSPGFRLAPAWPFTFRRPATRFRLTTRVAVPKTAVAPMPSPVAAS